MDHLRHHRNLVNPACLLSFNKYCLCTAVYQARGWVGDRQQRTEQHKFPSGSSGSPKVHTVRNGIANAITMRKSFVLCDNRRGEGYLLPAMPRFGK
jgi:hypothetical protein